MPEKLQHFASFALTLAAEARRSTLDVFGKGGNVENKLEKGFDPVTEADRGAELAMRRLIEAKFPDHGICGEEFPDRPAQGRLSWLLDPVDGTRAFICGLPSWSTLIALLDGGRPVVGVIDIPRLDELYLGHASTAELIDAGGRRAIRTSGCRSLAEALFSTTDPYLFSGSEHEGFERLRTAARLTRYGLDGYGYALVAAGQLDLVAESGLKPHDYNALIPVVRAAGGAIGDWKGGEDFSQGRVIAAATRELYEQAVETLRST